MLQEKAYLYGVLLGDGFYGYRYKKTGQLPDYVMLKAIDKEFVERFRDSIELLIGKAYSVYMVEPPKGNRRALFLCKCYAPEIVVESLKLTHERTEIPNFVNDGDDQIKLSFLQGLMDSEGWVTVQLNPLKMSHIGLYFSNSKAFTNDVWHMFRNVGVEVSKMYRRKFKDGRKDQLWFKINISDYIEQGLSFNIDRKKERLDFIFRILRDYTCKYKKAYFTGCVQDIVRPVVKAAGC